MQKGYNEVQAIEIELRILEQMSAPPSRPRKYFILSLNNIHNLYNISTEFSLLLGGIIK